MRVFMMTGSDHLASICNGTEVLKGVPSPQLRGFITRVVNPSQTLLGLVDTGMIVLVLVQVLW
jgi:hypothetical protein